MVAVRFRVSQGAKSWPRSCAPRRRGGHAGAYCRIYCSRLKAYVISSGASGKQEANSEQHKKRPQDNTQGRESLTRLGVL
jgi:hypothetical protein